MLLLINGTEQIMISQGHIQNSLVISTQMGKADRSNAQVQLFEMNIIFLAKKNLPPDIQF